MPEYLFKENFKTLNSKLWNIFKGHTDSFTIKNGLLKCTLSSNEEHQFSTKFILDGDWLIETKINLKQGGTVGLLFTVQEDNESYYMLEISIPKNKQKGKLTFYTHSIAPLTFQPPGPLRKYSGGVWTKMSTKQIDIHEGWHTLKVIRTGALYTCYLDDKLQHTTVEPLWASGYLGFRFWKSGVYEIDYITISRIATMKDYPRNPVIKGGKPGSWDKGVTVPGAILFEGGKLYLYYFGGITGTAIGIAWSDDLINWTKYERNPILEVGDVDSWDRGDTLITDNLHAGGIIKKPDGTYVLTYDAWNGECWEGIGIAIAKRPLGPFKKIKENPVLARGDPGEWDYKQIHLHTFFDLEDGKYAMLYTGYPGDDPQRKRDMWGLATSNDMVNWKKYEGNPVFKGGPLGACDENHCRPKSVVKVGKTFIGLYEGCFNDQGGAWWDSDCAVKSNDLVNWERYPYNPILPLHAGSTTWNNIVTEWPVGFIAGPKYYVLYLGGRLPNINIGLAAIDLIELQEWGIKVPSITNWDLSWKSTSCSVFPEIYPFIKETKYEKDKNKVSFEVEALIESVSELVLKSTKEPKHLVFNGTKIGKVPNKNYYKKTNQPAWFYNDDLEEIYIKLSKGKVEVYF
jgi:predicted GH43/DUF377 family glycosyl hydrolase